MALRLNNKRKYIKIPKLTQEGPVKPVLQTDIEQLSFASFLKCACKNDYSPLIISGYPSQHEIFFAWISVLSEYYTLINSSESLKYVKMVCKMERLNLKIFIVRALCEGLRQWYKPELIAALQKWGYSLQFTDETLLKDIARVETELGNDIFQLEKLRLSYESEEKKKTGKAIKPTKEHYMRVLYAIEKYRSQRYPPDKITLYEFGMWQNELIEYNRELEKIYNKNGK